MSTYKPSWEKILERYLLNYSKGGKAKLHAECLGLLDGTPARRASTSGFLTRVTRRSEGLPKVDYSE